MAEAFACVKEAIFRSLKIKLFDVQLLGALGVQVILEDYVSCLRLKVVLLFLTYAASLMTALAIFLIAVKSLI